MRAAPIFASSLAVLLAAATAAATTTEPNGLQVPRDSMNGEVQLYTFFSSQGESIDWLADAHTTPNAFSPLCGFTATFKLHQAGSSYDFAWYNETGQPPQATNDFHVLLPAGSPVGSMFNGTAIKNDPAYKGGLVGFALLVPGQPHCTNSAYDPVYATNQPWILSVIYASKNTPDAYYIAFEDGGAGPGNFSNDGDFNDDVYFVTGITCDGGDQPCDTGKPGICAAGLTQCSTSGTTCQQINQPAASETCNGLDDDCNGMVDDNATCPPGLVCDKGTCVQNCSSGEFPCPSGKVCDPNGFCIDPACQGVSCPAGQVCVGGACKGPCDGVTCPYPQVCRVGACVDPCAAVSCPSGQVCQDGVCVQSCDCAPCASGTTCDSASGHCTDPACVGKSCGAGTHCVSGSCVDDCMGAVCPTGQACMGGTCVMAAGTGGSSSSGVIFGTGGGSGAGGGTGNGSGNGGAGATGGASGTGGSVTPGKKSGCGCVVTGDGDGAGEAALGLLGLALVVSRRRRRG